jgi:hypothetical protein
VRWPAILAREAVLLSLDVAGLLSAIAWCAAVGHADHWHKGSTTMRLSCDRCGRVKNTIPRR